MRGFLGELCGALAHFAVKCFSCALLVFPLVLGETTPRVPPEIRYKSGYVNPIPKPPEFTSAMLWGIAIADTRSPGYENATVEIAHTKLICRADGHDVILNDDHGAVRGGLYRRFPWFGTDAHDPMPISYSRIFYSNDRRIVILRVGTRPDRVWHFWAASPRKSLPSGHLEGCTVKARVRISHGALLQVGFDYWRNATIGYESGGNNHEAGASKWYFPSPDWQDATFSDIPR